MAWMLFFRECGPEVMEAAYGWDNPPISPRPLETVFLLYTPEDGPVLKPVGWVSLTKNPQSPAWQSVSLGIRPSYVGRGFRRRALMMASDWAIEHNGNAPVSGVKNTCCVVVGAVPDVAHPRRPPPLSTIESPEHRPTDLIGRQTTSC